MVQTAPINSCNVLGRITSPSSLVWEGGIHKSPQFFEIMR